jgi:hypothetical protein
VRAASLQRALRIGAGFAQFALGLVDLTLDGRRIDPLHNSQQVHQQNRVHSGIVSYEVKLRPATVIHVWPHCLARPAS